MKTIKDFERRVAGASWVTDRLIFCFVVAALLSFINYCLRPNDITGFLPYVVSSVAAVVSILKWEYFCYVNKGIRIKKRFSKSKIDSLRYFTRKKKKLTFKPSVLD